MVTEHDLYKIVGDIYVYTDFKILKVKVPVIFLGTVGFSLRRDGRYYLYQLLLLLVHCAGVLACKWSKLRRRRSCSSRASRLLGRRY